MLVYTRVSDMQDYCTLQLAKGNTIGLVPTMGFFHEGHQSLIAQSAKDNDITVVSVFVNPTQFGPNEDYDSYPRDLEADKAKATEAGADVIFAPTPSEMYPDGYKTYVAVNDITQVLCGRTRPIHFRGVTTVVCKLFNIVRPTKAYFGQKDAQQLVVIKKMVSDLNMNLKIVPMPIVREADGLAKSSRNTYLNADERQRALILKKSLDAAKEMIDSGERNCGIIKEKMTEMINSAAPCEIDYVSVVNAETLDDIELIAGKVLIALAVKFGTTRLIDNIMFDAQ